jgi:hypothetical protein
MYVGGGWIFILEINNRIRERVECDDDHHIMKMKTI